MSGTIARFLASRRQDPRPQYRRQDPRPLARMIRVETIQPGFQEPLFPAKDSRSGRLQFRLKSAKGRTVGQHQDQTWRGTRIRPARNATERSHSSRPADS